MKAVINCQEKYSPSKIPYASPLASCKSFQRPFPSSFSCLFRPDMRSVIYQHWDLVVVQQYVLKYVLPKCAANGVVINPVKAEVKQVPSAELSFNISLSPSAQWNKFWIAKQIDSRYLLMKESSVLLLVQINWYSGFMKAKWFYYKRNSLLLLWKGAKIIIVLKVQILVNLKLQLQVQK